MVYYMGGEGGVIRYIEREGTGSSPGLAAKRKTGNGKVCRLPLQPPERNTDTLPFPQDNHTKMLALILESEICSRTNCLAVGRADLATSASSQSCFSRQTTQVLYCLTCLVDFP